MTTAEAAIAKKILDLLHEEEGRQLHALTIHAGIGGMAACSATVFDSVLAQLDTRKYVVGIKTKFKGVLWNISDAGEAARLEM